MNTLDRDYQTLVKDIMENGRSKGDRTGTGTVSVFGREIRHDMATGFPLLTTKKMSLKNIKTELYWFLQGDTNIKFLVDRGCNIWNGDAYKAYTKRVLGEPLSYGEFVDMIKTNGDFALEHGELGPIYGKQWCDWGGVNQITQLIKDLVENPDSRRLKVEAWNVGELKDMVLPPCHTGFQCYTEGLTYKERYDLWFQRNYETGMEYDPDGEEVDFDLEHYRKTPKRRLSLKWTQRSVDTGLGLPYNIASYGLLLLMLADEVGMEPGDLIGSLGDTHLYKNHLKPIEKQLFREPYKLPTVVVMDGINSHCDGNDIILKDYQYHPPINLPLSN